MLTTHLDIPWARPEDPAREGLGADEIRMLGLLAEGYTADVAARHLGISPRTLRRRMAALQDRLGVCSQMAAVVLAVRRGWI